MVMACLWACCAAAADSETLLTIYTQWKGSSEIEGGGGGSIASCEKWYTTVSD